MDLVAILVKTEKSCKSKVSAFKYPRLYLGTGLNNFDDKLGILQDFSACA